MNKSKKWFHTALFGCLVFTAFAGVYFGNVNEKLNKSNECLLDSLACHYEFEGKYFSLIFEQVPQTEEELFIRFDLPENYRVKNAWIEGINMYMGKSPVIFDDSPQRGVTFLGSCNLDTMQWALYVKLEKLNADPINQEQNEKTENNKIFSVLFTTSNSE